ncbi:PIN domain nuclease [uncultured Umboniibacter sp.]|uniref:type II toxin-antitoxin system VapC family toxin n=1 Tax=uncultured Umboniibacter sp. TaxID=1798917 RepID=UPI00261EFBC4|nr:PIN domain nuclease [uncultured Umboniibacter sp.]
MILADSSVWIDYLNGIHSLETERLDEALNDDVVVMGDLILVEILQGFRKSYDYKLAKANLLLLEQHEMLGTPQALRASEHFCFLRTKGITVRKTNDIVIASYCINEGIPLLFTDRDFEPFVKYLGLKSVVAS